MNIAELLKDCPSGMELDCTCADNVVFDKIIEYDQIKCVIGECREPLILDKYGRLQLCCPKCVIFPKGKTTWEGFQRPFKDGDIITCTNSLCSFVAIFKELNTNTSFSRYVSLTLDDKPQFWTKEGLSDFKKPRFATEEEKQKLFQAIKDNGYKWNPETKTLEKLIVPKFKVGDRIKVIYKTYEYVIKGITDTHYTLEEVEDKFQYTEPIIEDKNWELVPNKFDITTLKPFNNCKYSLDGGKTWKFAQYWYIHDKYDVNDIEIELWQD